MEADSVNWDTIMELLPVGEGDDYEERVKEMFELFNVNDQKGLTVFEIENGVVDMTQTGDMFDSEKAINDSFSHASRLKWEKEKSMMDKLDYTQFKLFLRILRMTYNFYEAFNYVDSDGEHIITRDTFCEDATKKVLERWLGPREDWEEEFNSIDMTNKKGDGNVLFREFFDWALNKNIDFQGDMGVNQ
eukprot:TRINITY_DN20162_c0_g1_i2.p1 TRINITY_DN20162_c0_g1~~TRINITY_DN20162_c0_g1_i2.p1  ORF type:complete len:189 (-),score=61.92 TRINITY_DN20162_c0_g1_i2:146-712(-)